MLGSHVAWTRAKPVHAATVSISSYVHCPVVSGRRCHPSPINLLIYSRDPPAYQYTNAIKCTNVVGITNHSLMEFKAHCMRCNPCLTPLGSRDPETSLILLKEHSSKVTPKALAIPMDQCPAQPSAVGINTETCNWTMASWVLTGTPSASPSLGAQESCGRGTRCYPCHPVLGKRSWRSRLDHRHRCQS